MHPIEHLRYVARSADGDPVELTQQAAIALASLAADGRQLVVACRRVVERHPTVGPMWWLCSNLLLARDPAAEAWRSVDALDADPTADVLAEALPADAIVLAARWSPIVAAAVAQRADVDLGRAAGHAGDGGRPVVVAIEADAVGPTSAIVAGEAIGLANLDNVWCISGVGRMLPVGYATAAAAAVARGRPAGGRVALLGADRIERLVSPRGVTGFARGYAAECAVATELLRASPI